MKQSSKIILEKFCQWVAMTIGCVVGLIICRSCEAKKQANTEVVQEAPRKIIGSDYMQLYLGEENPNLSVNDFVDLEKICKHVWVDTHTSIIYVLTDGNGTIAPVIEADGTALTFGEWSKRYYDDHHKE